ncbi:putative membrane protein/MT1776 [Rubripirellula lacrimiformis]|uniref:Putative membrane protein/MT1776 n=1 Tax=Rubripirellula lacrimiformis TaxID=1930273 RepID=A0A517ND16_9BACT|nr:tellurite resistance/C4-dicarboxylate transporter family protein [Rubripirellula lacrimiformis]QDT05032.1 putative membrane protein/MT1776 [Rubripirellula lacrimiformis]
MVAALDPSCYSIVMATGIVSLACWHHGGPHSPLHGIATILLWGNLLAFTVMAGLTAGRLFWHPHRMVADFGNPHRSFGMFSIVAASCVLGSQFLAIWQRPNAAIGLWCFGIASWFLLTYGIFCNVTIQKNKGSLKDGLHGGWLLAVVAAQSVSLLGALLSPQFTETQDIVLFFSLAMWLGGGMLYAWIISLVFYRYCFEPVDVDSMTPPYWINMGAMAISTFAGCSIIEAVGSSSRLGQFLPFVRGGTLLCWATATWWIPLLVAFGVWRHAYHKVSLAYDLRYYSIVFPLGMYSVATQAAIHCFGIDFLAPIGTAFLYIALAAWTITTIGLTKTRWKSKA